MNLSLKLINKTFKRCSNEMRTLYNEKKASYVLEKVYNIVSCNDPEKLRCFLDRHPSYNFDGLVSAHIDGNNRRLRHENLVTYGRQFINKSPLMLAIDKGFNECAQILLDFGCNPNSLTEEGESALFFTENNLKGLELLVNAGGDIHIHVDRKGPILRGTPRNENLLSFSERIDNHELKTLIDELIMKESVKKEAQLLSLNIKDPNMKSKSALRI